MSLTELIVVYLINLVFLVWVVRWGGAEWLEGTFTSGFLISVFAPSWSSEGIKLFGWGSIILSTILFIVAIFFPDFRYFF